MSDVLDKLVPASPTVSIGAGLPGEGFAAAGAAVLKLADTVQGEKNTPAEIKAQLELHAQAAKDAMQRAIDRQDIDTLRKMAALLPEAGA